VPGPQYSLYLCRRRMLEIFPYVPLALDVALGVAVCSYDGSLTFGITGDGDLGRDVEILASGIQHAVDELLARAADKDRPVRSPRSRASTRRPGARDPDLAVDQRGS